MSERRHTTEEVMIQVSRILMDRDAYAEFKRMTEEYGDTLRATAFMDSLKVRLEALPAPEEESFERKVWMLDDWQEDCTDISFPARWKTPEEGQKFVDSWLNGARKVVPVTICVRKGHHD